MPHRFPRALRSTPAFAAALSLYLFSGCSGSIGVPGSSPPEPGGGAAQPRPTAGMPPPQAERPAGTCRAVSPGPSPLRRLNRQEYVQTARDLLGEEAAAIVDLPDEERALGFNNSAEGRGVSDLLAGRYVETAEKLSALAVRRLPSVLPCDPTRTGEATCLGRFLDSFGKRAWRRPLEPEERANLERAFQDGKTSGEPGGNGAFADGIEAVAQVLLLSPQFLYRVERGFAVPGASYRRLTPWELASRLSYLLWGSMPDEALLAAAESGQLAGAAAVKAQATRMLQDPRAARMVSVFADQWLRIEELGQLEKEPMFFPSFRPELRASMRMETQTFIEQVLWKGDGKLGTLLTAPYTFVDGPLAQYYGLSGVTGPDFQKVSLPAGQGAGLLTHAGLLAVLGVPDGGLTSLIFRGLFVRERLLCSEIPDPPPDAQDMSPPFTPLTTAREWSQARGKVALCGACHSQMDPIGFGLEAFDGAGLWRDSDHGRPVDTRGELVGSDVDGPFEGAIELGRRLAGSKQVQRCLATQLFRYASGRREGDPDRCSLDVLDQAFDGSGGDVRELLLALTQTDAFLFLDQGDLP